MRRLERAGRRLLAALLGRLVARARARRRSPPPLPPRPRVLVIRLDVRLGNAVLLTPLLAALRARLPTAHVTLLAAPAGAALLAAHPALDAVLLYRKRALGAADGPLRLPWRLRRRRFDLVIDAANPTDPSTTQACLSWACGAGRSIGSAAGAAAGLYTDAVPCPPGPPLHEARLRRRLLLPLGASPASPGGALPTLPPPPLPPAAPIVAFVAALSRPFVAINVGARDAGRCLGSRTYAALAGCCRAAGLQPLFTWGPAERERAEAARAQAAAAGVAVWMAPPTDVAALAHVLGAAAAVIAADTGPMHLAVALGTPTCGIFVRTSPQRYGYAEGGHARIDARSQAASAWLPQVAAWCAAHAGAPPRPL